MSFFFGGSLSPISPLTSTFSFTVERTQRVPSKISSLIQDAESKSAAKKKSSMENLSLVKRESPLGGEDNTIAKSDDLSNAPKLPPKPGKPHFPFSHVN